jgi:cell division protein FtsB
MQVKDPFSQDSVDSFKQWWYKRIGNRENRPPMPDFFEVWNARQPEIESLRKENEHLKNEIQRLQSQTK